MVDAKAGSGLGPAEHSFERNDFLARLLQHVPEPRLHQVRVLPTALATLGAPKAAAPKAACGSRLRA